MRDVKISIQSIILVVLLLWIEFVKDCEKGMDLLPWYCFRSPRSHRLWEQPRAHGRAAVPWGEVIFWAHLLRYLQILQRITMPLFIRIGTFGSDLDFELFLCVAVNHAPNELSSFINKMTVLIIKLGFNMDILPGLLAVIGDQSQYFHSEIRPSGFHFRNHQIFGEIPLNSVRRHGFDAINRRTKMNGIHLHLPPETVTRLSSEPQFPHLVIVSILSQ